MEKGDKGSTLTRMGVSGWMFLLVPAYPGCPGQTAVKWLLLLLQKSLLIWKNGRMTEILGINMGVMVQEMWSPTVHKKNHRSRNETEHCENFTQNRRTFKGCINTQIHKRHVFSVLETILYLTISPCTYTFSGHMFNTDCILYRLTADTITQQ